MRAHAEMAPNHGRTADANALMAALLTEGEDDEITRLRERIGELIGARGLDMLSDVARYADAFTDEGQQPQGMTQAATKGKGKGAVNRGLTVTRAGRSVRMICEAGNRLSLATNDLSVLLMPGDNLQNDDQIAAGHPGVTYLGNAPPQQSRPFSGQGNRLGDEVE